MYTTIAAQNQKAISKPSLNIKNLVITGRLLLRRLCIRHLSYRRRDITANRKLQRAIGWIRVRIIEITLGVDSHSAIERCAPRRKKQLLLPLGAIPPRVFQSEDAFIADMNV